MRPFCMRSINRPQRINGSQQNNRVKMVGYNHPFVQHDIGAQFGSSSPFVLHNGAITIRNHPFIFDVPKYAAFAVGAKRDEISAAQPIIITAPPNRASMMKIWVKHLFSVGFCGNAQRRNGSVHISPSVISRGP